MSAKNYISSKFNGQTSLYRVSHPARTQCKNGAAPFVSVIDFITTSKKHTTGLKEHTGNIFRLWFELWFKLWFGVWLKLWPKIEESSMISLRGGGLVAAFFWCARGDPGSRARPGPRDPGPGPGPGRGPGCQDQAWARARTNRCSHLPTISKGNHRRFFNFRPEF